MRIVTLALCFVIVPGAYPQERIFEASARGVLRPSLDSAVALVTVSGSRTLDEVLLSLQPAGATAGHLTGVKTTWRSGAASNQFKFSIPIPAGRYDAVLDALARIAAGNGQTLPVLVPGGTTPLFTFSIRAQPTDQSTTEAIESLAADLFDNARSRIDAASAAAAAGPVQIVSVILDRYPSGEVILRLRAEKASPFQRRSIRVPVSGSLPAPLDESTIHVRVATPRSIARTDVMNRMAQAGVPETALTAESFGVAGSERAYLFELVQPSARADDAAAAIYRVLVDSSLGPLQGSVETIRRTSAKAESSLRESALPDLIAAARDQAAVLARKMNGRLGAIRGVLDHPEAAISLTVAETPTFVFLSPLLVRTPGNTAASIEFFVE